MSLQPHAMQRYSRVAAVVVAASLSACASDVTDGAPATTSGRTVPVTNYPTITSPTSPITVVSSSTTTKAPITPPSSTSALSTVSVRWMWPPLFVVPGTQVPLELVVDPALGINSIEVTSSDGHDVDAHFEGSTQRWRATITIRSDFEASQLVLTAQASKAGAILTSETLTIPVVPGSIIIEPMLEGVGSQQVAALRYGDGPDQIGFVRPAGDGETVVPAAFDIDPRTGNLVLLDNANDRVLLLDANGHVDMIVALPEPGALNDIVVNGNTGYATVSQFEVRSSTIYAAAYQINLNTATYETVGPEPLPADPPEHVATIWNSANHTVYVQLLLDESGGFYPFLDTRTLELVVGNTPEQWWTTAVPPDKGVGVRYESTELTTTFPYSSPTILDTRIAIDGTIWMIVTTNDTSVPAGPESWHTFIVRTSPTCATAAATEIDFDARYSVTRYFTVLGSTGYVQDIGPESYTIDAYDLPIPPC